MPFLAALFLGEGLSRGRIGATIAGFLGVLIMLDPESGVGAFPVAVGLAGAFCVALVMIVIKKLTRTEQALAVLAWFTILSSMGVAPIAAAVWVWPQPSQWLALISLGLTGSVGQYLMIRAYRVGEASAITPVDYTQLVFACLFGVFLFDELPGLRSLAGMAVIAASTLYITWQERGKSGPSEIEAV
jgi:drug/metabolite transporter (DMT)-like permease